MSIVPRIKQGGVLPATSGDRPRPKASSGWWPGYMRGEASPVFRGWNPMPRDPADTVRSAWTRAAGRALDIIHNSGWISGAIDQAVANTVGTGLRPRLTLDAEVMGWDEDQATDWCARAEARFLNLWATNPYECDIEGRRTFAQMQAAAFRSWFGPGEIVSECAWKRRPGGAYGSKVRLIPAHRLSQRTAYPRLVQGVQMDEDWMPTSYWFWRRNTPTGTEQEIEVEARDRYGRPRIVHVFDGVPGQYRGISPLVAALATARRFDQLTESKLTANLIQAVFAATIKSDEPTEEILKGLLTPQEQARMASDGMSAFDAWAAMNEGWYKSTNIDLGINGRFAHLFPGQELEFHSASQSSADFKDLALFLLREILRCLGLTYESGTGDYSGATYSSVRMATSEIFQITLYRRENIVGPFSTPHFLAWLEEDIERGGTPFPDGVAGFLAKRPALTLRWTGTPKPEADNLKTAKTWQTYRDMGVATDEAICADQGLGDVHDVYKQRAREMRLRAKYGLPENGPAPTPDPVADKLVVQEDN
ncbi:phage portal protein [Methylobacterium sp. WSM2598]|uniref:phage portal protein n=1 Tax=Methylobacterium sp. WSM2598 TaxID=398261 RepID=UPI0003AB27BB|nr:phage portal protein [Methylobacterium sp. WSM2598]